MAEKIIEKVYRDLQYSVGKYSKLHKEMKNDFEFVQGKQWEDKDVDTLRKQGVKALVINKIKPIIKLITGIERQSKSDFVGFPEGGEDSLVADMVTRLLKNVSKTGDLATKTSIQFKNSAIGGVSYIEPYIDYSVDLINGTLRFKNVSGTDVFPDPDHIEYDMSDAKYVIKLTRNLSEEDLELLFPDDTAKIKKIKGGRINLNSLNETSGHIQGLDYPGLGEGTDADEFKDSTYDLIDYQYKTIRTAYYIADQQRGVIKEAESKEKAEEVSAQIPGSVVISKKVPAYKLYQAVGDQVFYDGDLWSYPKWQKYTLIPLYAEFNTENVGKKELSIQGVVRVIKDLQEEFNKRRTQELRHLNSSANSGFDIHEGQMASDEEERKLKEFGSSPGVVLKRAKGTDPLIRITPMPLSQGHAQAAAEHAQDLKEASGVNPDLLATDSNSQSGRAILLKQRQGLVMVQEMLDNYSITKKIIGRFILSQMKELFTVESAMRVIGDQFIQEAFTVPVTAIIQRGLDKMAENKDNEVTELEKANMLMYPQNSAMNPVVDEKNQLVPAVDFDEAFKLVDQVLNDSEIGKYDISVGEGPFSETVRLSNFISLTDLAQQGVPIPPTALIEMSLIPDNEKKKIIAQMEAMAAQQMQMQKQQMAIEAKGAQ